MNPRQYRDTPHPDRNQKAAVGDVVMHNDTGTKLEVVHLGHAVVRAKVIELGPKSKPGLKIGEEFEVWQGWLGSSYTLMPKQGITEDNMTTNLDGGAGQPNTPNAFAKGTKSRGLELGKDSNAFTEPAKESHRWGVKFESLTKMAGLQEVSYRSFKATEGTDKAKINLAIREAYQKVLEAEKIINNASKLKLEVGANQGVFWKQSGVKFQKLAERLTRLGTTLRELNK